MIKLLLHSDIFGDVKKCQKKNWHRGLDKEIPRVCRLLIQDGKMPGERPIHHIKNLALHNKTLHAGIPLPLENVGKKKGARIVYIKEDFDLIKIIYLGGHKDKHRYNDSYKLVDLIEERYFSKNYIKYTEGIKFS